MLVLGLRFCARVSSGCGERGLLFIAVHRPLTIRASFVVEHRLQTRRLSSSGSRAQLLCGMWDLPRPGLEPVSPALAGRFSTTVPPRKPPCTGGALLAPAGDKEAEEAMLWSGGGSFQKLRSPLPALLLRPPNVRPLGEKFGGGSGTPSAAPRRPPHAASPFFFLINLFI